MLLTQIKVRKCNILSILWCFLRYENLLSFNFKHNLNSLNFDDIIFYNIVTNVVHCLIYMFLNGGKMNTVMLLSIFRYIYKQVFPTDLIDYIIIIPLYWHVNVYCFLFLVCITMKQKHFEYHPNDISFLIHFEVIFLDFHGI